MFVGHCGGAGDSLSGLFILCLVVTLKVRPIFALLPTVSKFGSLVSKVELK